MKFMLLIYGAELHESAQWRQQSMRHPLSLSDELKNQGKWITASLLHSVATATSVRVRDGQRHVSDGPYAETAQQLGGYCIIDADNRDEALDIASRLPAAQQGTIEIRPLLPLPESLTLPEDRASQPASTEADFKDYIVLLYAEAGAWPADEHAVALAESVQICHQLHAAGQFLSAAPLQPPATAACLRIRHGSRAVVDGPFAETKEQLGGYFLIRVRNLDEAIAIAARIPGSRRGTAEIRPLLPLVTTNA